MNVNVFERDGMLVIKETEWPYQEIELAFPDANAVQDRIRMILLERGVTLRGMF